MKRCNVYHRYARNNAQIKMPVHVSLPLVSFGKWGNDYVREVHPHFSK